jgi:UDP-N-acetyl-D-glucosamine dehydrogenase
MNMNYATNLIEKIESSQAVCGVIGLGYVGLPLVCEFARSGFSVIGFDVSKEKCDAINRGESYIADVPSSDLSTFVSADRVRATTDFARLAEVDTINICVPTPLRKTKDPDVSFIVSAVNEIARHLRPGQLVVLESTTYPGTTDELILPTLEKTGLSVAKDFFLAFSPERVDPGNERYQTRNIPKVVGGHTPECVRVATALYRKTVDTVVEVSSTRVAEMVKLHENTFRSVNIGLVNELALMCNEMDINVWEVINAAATKPFGFTPFYPGPGLGGHCIPIDPFYLSWKARQHGFEARFIELAGHINTEMPNYVARKITEALNSRSKAVRDSKILIAGVAYKPNVDDARESPAFDLVAILNKWGAKIAYTDPLIDEFGDGTFSMTSVPFTSSEVAKYDCVAIITDHSGFDFELLRAESGPVVVDTRNALKGWSGDHIFRL